MNFIFLHVGEDIRPSFLVKSIRKFFPEASIFQCTDKATKEIEGVDHIYRYDGNIKNLMTFRLEAFSSLDIKQRSVYLDTDMLVLKSFNLDEYNNYDVVLCKRNFGCNDPINVYFKGMNIFEYENKTFGEIYPYLASFTVTSSSTFWKEASDILISLDKKFHFWYGDQEALKIIKQKNIFNIGTLEESIFSCLPEYIDKNNIPNVIHFKGVKRKKLMLNMAIEMGLV